MSAGVKVESDGKKPNITVEERFGFPGQGGFYGPGQGIYGPGIGGGYYPGGFNQGINNQQSSSSAQATSSSTSQNQGKLKLFFISISAMRKVVKKCGLDQITLYQMNNNYFNFL